MSGYTICLGYGCAINSNDLYAGFKHLASEAVQIIGSKIIAWTALADRFTERMKDQVDPYRFEGIIAVTNLQGIRDGLKESNRFSLPITKEIARNVTIGTYHFSGRWYDSDNYRHYWLTNQERRELLRKIDS